MTCVWKGLIESLDLRIKPDNFLMELQEENTETIDMLYNGKPLTKQNYMENIERINSLTSKSIRGGYDCSACDPLLLLVGQIYSVSIEHTFVGKTFQYTNVKSNQKIKVESDEGHFWSVTKLDKNNEKRRKRKRNYKSTYH